MLAGSFLFIAAIVGGKCRWDRGEGGSKPQTGTQGAVALGESFAPQVEGAVQQMDAGVDLDDVLEDTMGSVM